MLEPRVLVHDSERVWHYVQSYIAVHGPGQPHTQTVTIPPQNKTYQILRLNFNYEVLRSGSVYTPSKQLHRNPLLHLKLVNAETADAKAKRAELLEWVSRLQGEEHMVVLLHPALMAAGQHAAPSRHHMWNLQKNPTEKAQQRLRDLAGKLGERQLRLYSLAGGDTIDLLREVREVVFATFNKRLRTLLDARQQHEDVLAAGAPVGPYVAAANDCGLLLQQFALVKESYLVYEGLSERLDTLSPQVVNASFTGGGLGLAYAPKFDGLRGLWRAAAGEQEDLVSDLQRGAHVSELSVRMLCIVRMVRTSMQQKKGKDGAVSLTALFNDVWLPKWMAQLRRRGVADAAVDMLSMCLRLSFAATLGHWAREWDRPKRGKAAQEQAALQAGSVPTSVLCAGPSYADVMYRARESLLSLGRAQGLAIPRSVKDVDITAVRAAANLSLESYLQSAHDAAAPYAFRALRSQEDFEECYIAMTMHCVGHNFTAQRHNLCNLLEWEVIPCLASRGYFALAMNLLFHQMDFFMNQGWHALHRSALEALLNIVSAVLGDDSHAPLEGLSDTECRAYSHLWVLAALNTLGIQHTGTSAWDAEESRREHHQQLWRAIAERMRRLERDATTSPRGGSPSVLSQGSYYDPALNENFLSEAWGCMLPRKTGARGSETPSPVPSATPTPAGSRVTSPSGTDESKDEHEERRDERVRVQGRQKFCESPVSPVVVEEEQVMMTTDESADVDAIEQLDSCSSPANQVTSTIPSPARSEDGEVAACDKDAQESAAADPDEFAYPLHPFVTIKGIRFVTMLGGEVRECMGNDGGREVHGLQPEFTASREEEGRKIGMYVDLTAAAPLEGVPVTMTVRLTAAARGGAEGPAVCFSGEALTGGANGTICIFAAAEVNDEGCYAIQSVRVCVGPVAFAHARTGSTPIVPPPGLSPLPVDEEAPGNVLSSVRLCVRQQHVYDFSVCEDAEHMESVRGHVFSGAVRRFRGRLALVEGTRWTAPALSTSCKGLEAPEGAAAWLVVGIDTKAVVGGACSVTGAGDADVAVVALGGGMRIEHLGFADGCYVYAVYLQKQEQWAFAIEVPAAATAGEITADFVYQLPRLQRPSPVLTLTAAAPVVFEIPFEASSHVTLDGDVVHIQLLLKNRLDIDISITDVLPTAYGAYNARKRRCCVATQPLAKHASVARMFVLELQRSSQGLNIPAEDCRVDFDVMYTPHGLPARSNVYRPATTTWAPPCRPQAIVSVQACGSIAFMAPTRFAIDIAFLPHAFEDGDGDTPRGYWAELRVAAADWLVMGHTRRLVTVSKENPSASYSVRLIPVHRGSLPVPSLHVASAGTSSAPVEVDTRAPQGVGSKDPSKIAIVL